jgi:molybdopterin molybdotransferase
MITSAEASRIILDNAITWGGEKVPLDDAVGRILDEGILADRPFPPFNRVCMDGIAIQYASLENGTPFEVEKIIGAGEPQGHLLDAAKCIEIMTGAPLPLGTDTVIRYEDLEENGTGYKVLVAPGKGKNIHYQGEDHAAGQVLLSKGQSIKAIDVNVLASVGKYLVRVKRLPKVAVVSSGDELVAVSENPLPHQIRRSNAPMLKARLRELGISAKSFHLVDRESDISDTLGRIAEGFDAILISGGVSKGKYDFLPAELDKLGFAKLFHRVRQRPGKPFWFGRRGGTIVFAFPGNPVSTLACFHKYFIPWFRGSMGQPADTGCKVALAESVHFRPSLTYFAQAALSYGADGRLWATVRHGNGSGDMVSPTRMDGFIEFPADREVFDKGEVFPFMPFHPILG